MAPLPDESPRDVDDFSRAVAQAYFPHEVTPRSGRKPPQQARLETLDLGPALIGYVGWGADVQVECDYPDAYEINMPLAGRLESSGRHGTITSQIGDAAVFRPDTPTLISHWDAQCTVLGVKFDSAWLNREAERILGRDVARVGELLPDKLILDSAPARAWRRLVTSLASDLSESGLFRDLPSVRDQLAGALADGFLLASCPDTDTSPPPRPRAVAKVVDAIHDDPAHAWTVGQMAVIGGMSARRLQETFRRWLDSAPMDYVTQIRLQRAHSDLADDPTESISDIAARWGFSSASRFAAAYRRRYGASPSQQRG
jgi:AraC-like DNA-binding protein